MEAPAILETLEKELNAINALIEEARKTIEDNDSKRKNLIVAIQHLKLAYGVTEKEVSFDVLSNNVFSNLDNEIANALKVKYPAAVLNASVKNEYSSSLNWPDKIMFALNEIKEGFAFQISDKIKELDSKLDDGIIAINVTNYASKLKQVGKLSSVFVGNKSKYRIA